MTIRLSNGNRNAALDAINAAINNGTGTVGGVIKVFTGTVHPTFGTAPEGTLITSVVLDAIAFVAASNGSMVAALSTPKGTPSPAALVAGCFTVSDRDDQSVLDGDVSSNGGSGDLQLSDINIGNGVILQIDTFTITAGNSPA